MLRKFESFISDTEAVLQGSKEFKLSSNTNHWESLVSARNSVFSFLKDDFDTSSAVQTISEYIDIFNRYFTNAPATPTASSVDYGLVLSSSAFVKDFTSLVGITEDRADVSNESQTSGAKLDSVLSEFVKFRSTVRHHALAFEEVNNMCFIILFLVYFQFWMFK